MNVKDQIGDLSVDVGLRNHMAGIYSLLAKGIAVSALTAFAVSQTHLFYLFFTLNEETGRMGLSLLGYAAFFAPLALLLLQMFNFIPRTLVAAQAVYWSFVTMKGVMLTMLALYFPAEAIIQALAVTAAVFGATSLYGYTTKRNLGPFAGFLMMGLFGMIFALIANIFLGSGALSFAISMVGVLVFSGFIAWETQAMKEMYEYNRNDEQALKLSRYEAALSMYISIMALFRSLLNLTSSR
jgi:FtsH-binding integral membrane protein